MTSFVLKVAQLCVHIKRNRNKKREMCDVQVSMRNSREIWAIHQLHAQAVSSRSVSDMCSQKQSKIEKTMWKVCREIRADLATF